MVSPELRASQRHASRWLPWNQTFQTIRVINDKRAPVFRGSLVKVSPYNRRGNARWDRKAVFC